MSTPPLAVASGQALTMLHLGLGSFHRAHQAVYFQRLLDLGDTCWTLAGGNIRPDMPHTMAALQAQQGAYTLETVTPAQERSYTQIESIKTVVPYEPMLAGLVALGSDPATRIVSFTVTEAGYYLDAQDRLDWGFDDLAADLARARAGLPGGTVYGALTAILRRRMQRHPDGGAARLTLLCCDNLRHNGDRSHSGLLQFIEAVGDPPLLAWVRAHTCSPNAMVDRITPRPTPDVVERVKAATGRDDPVAVMGESYIQWVIEDRFANGRPDWERVGVEMVASVAAHEEAKIRLLNATHSCIAWAGTLAGYTTIDQGVRDPQIHAMAFDYVTNDTIPLLQPSPIDLAQYRDVVLERFGNSALQDTNQRVAMDAFSKIPGMIAPTVAEGLARGRSVDSVAMLPALFLAYLQRWHAGTLASTYSDQAMNPQVAHAICQAPDSVAAFAADPLLWGGLAGDARLVDVLRRAYARVQQFERERQSP